MLSADGQAQHWILTSGEQFGWISGGKLVPLPPGLDSAAVGRLVTPAGHLSPRTILAWR